MTPDHATPNLPSRDLAATACFYAKLGFAEHYRGDEWMILKRGGLTLEFFRNTALDPVGNQFSCCLRLEDLETFYARCRDAGIAEARKGMPRLHPAKLQPWGARMAALIDPDGTLLHLVQNR